MFASFIEFSRACAGRIKNPSCTDFSAPFGRLELHYSGQSNKEKYMPLVLTKEKLEAAMKEAGIAAEILKDVIREASELNCPAASGFEGPNTFGECGTCLVCLAHEVRGVPHFQ
jgi:hypothetical protein